MLIPAQGLGGLKFKSAQCVTVVLTLLHTEDTQEQFGDSCRCLSVPPAPGTRCLCQLIGVFWVTLSLQNSQPGFQVSNVCAKPVTEVQFHWDGLVTLQSHGADAQRDAAPTGRASSPAAPASETSLRLRDPKGSGFLRCRSLLQDFSPSFLLAWLQGVPVLLTALFALFSRPASAPAAEIGVLLQSSGGARGIGSRYSLQAPKQVFPDSELSDACIHVPYTNNSFIK